MASVEEGNNSTATCRTSNALCGRQRVVDSWNEARKKGDETTLDRLRNSRLACYIGNCCVQPGLGSEDMVVAYDKEVDRDQLATGSCLLWNIYTPIPL